MTYSLFLGLFLCLPIAALAMALRGRWNGRMTAACGAVCGLAFLYTSPWDNHAAKIRLWTFDPHFAPPSHFVFYLPWEEYAFYFAQGILICLLVAVLARWLKPSAGRDEL